MIKNNSGESLVGIIIGIFILSFILIGIGNLLISSKYSLNKYNEQKDLYILKLNIKNILSKLDLSSIANNENFYIYNNIFIKKYEIFTGSINQKFQYIDRNGNYINNTGTYLNTIYSRKLQINRILLPDGSEYKTYDIQIAKLIK